MSVDIQFRLPSVACPSCGRTLESDEFVPNAGEGRINATCIEDCLRRCSVCGLGVSNANTARVDKLTVMYIDPLPECALLHRRRPPEGTRSST